MMKKIALTMIMLLAILIMSACYSYVDTIILDESCLLYSQYEPINTTQFYEQAMSNEEFLECTDDRGEVLAYDKHFRIIRPVDLPDWYLQYEIFNRYGELVKSFTVSRPSWIEYINETVLEIGISAGTGVRMVQFYSVKDDVFSDVFDSPFLIKDEIIAYIVRYNDALKLIVQDIFNPAVYYREFLFEEFEYTVRSSSSTYVEYIGDGRIRIMYLLDENSEYTSIVLEL